MKLIIQEEKSKEEIIYNHILSTLSKEEQIQYLKNKVFILEKELKTRMCYTLLFLFSFLLLCLGILFLTLDLYVLGIISIVAVFLFVILKFMFTIRSYSKSMQDSAFGKIEDLKKSLEQKLK